MPSLIKNAVILVLLLSPAAFPAGFSLITPDPGSWPEILSSIGFSPQPAAAATLYVGRSGSPASPHWQPKLDAGAFLILEGESPLAASFGIHPTKQTYRLAALQDVHRPNLPIILEHPLELSRFDLPKDARIFAKERWTGAPLIAGFRRGAGAVLWVAVSPGPHGYERFPYILHALADLGLEPPFHSSRLWAFFDYSYRTRVDLDYFAARWRKSGIGALHVAAWHFFESDPERDAYLKQLIEACHKQGILIYAWVELPHVSEKFWNDHPEWREKTAVLQDAHLDWRKLMNLANRDCFRAVSLGVQDLVHRFDWDGVNLAELYFESLEGASNPARFTPMNDDVRARFKAEAGFDPLEIYSTRKDAASLRAFLDFRAGLARHMQEDWLGEIEKCRQSRPNLDLVLTHVDDRLDTGMKDAIGADSGRVLPLLAKHDFTFLIEDPATVWNLGPQRYPEIAKRYKPLTPRTDKLAIDINITDRYQDVYPTKQQTGTELFELVHLAARAFPRVALYFENSILTPDLPFLPAASAVVDRAETIGGKQVIDTPQGIGIPWTGPALVDGKPWPVQSETLLFLPAGTHTLEKGVKPGFTRLVDFNGLLKSAQALSDRRIEISYQSSGRALAIFDRQPVRLDVDGAESPLESLSAPGRFTVLLPRGQHLATIHM
ncbi:MAG: hypothetical protein M3Z23_03050 [Acidobacteriota bacterium]|nr:hypothetical protein [Acidobacteriota bacterium]